MTETFQTPLHVQKAKSLSLSKWNITIIILESDKALDWEINKYDVLQEMHSPSANGPASIGDGEGAAASPIPPCPTQEPPQKEERRKESPQAATPEVKNLDKPVSYITRDECLLLLHVSI